MYRPLNKEQSDFIKFSYATLKPVEIAMQLQITVDRVRTHMRDNNYQSICAIRNKPELTEQQMADILERATPTVSISALAKDAGADYQKVYKFLVGKKIINARIRENGSYISSSIYIQKKEQLFERPPAVYSNTDYSV